MKKIIIFGGTGFIGISLAQHLKKQGLTPILIARNKPSNKLAHEFDFMAWDGQQIGNWAEELNGAHAVINLCGKSVDCIKTPVNCDEILKSRVDTTKLIGDAMKALVYPPKIWVQMSTAHIYGDSETIMCTEDASEGYGLAPFVGRKWEEAFHSAKLANTRGVILRTSFVIGKNGGPMQVLKRLTKFGLGGTIANGKQGMSWIHQDDINEIIYQALIDEKHEGVYNISAPKPVSNKLFMKHLRKTLKVPFGLPAPEFLVRLGSKLIFKTDPELAIYGRYIIPERLNKIGFKFRFNRIEEAFKDLVG